ncbi:cytochrome P450 [Deinococcus sp. Arct2-2]|uniref:cytochrome P450 n=1 Tax=Deinococcus sp. Arct2-2 TaxID=2568653 RepID=UPI0010A2C59C|nr:cytochrome P450 [Deinococcus sp. Arct2-2]THF71534.1 cytochrome P450 [Deinococcus sp. Arct2-2]
MTHTDSNGPSSSGGCPFHHSTTPSLTNHNSAPATDIQVDQGGVYRVQGFAAAREVLRAEGVRQAGFMAETVRDTGLLKNQPVLFAEGEEHHAMRRDTARYFTPTQVADYQPMIARHADALITKLARAGELNLDDLSLTLAVQVAARVVGLTDSLAPGLERRVMAFVEGGGDSEPGKAQARGRIRGLQQQANLSLFFLLDVKPAIQARRKQRRDDLISHLLDKGYNDLDILTECLTYGTAGMVTTREFISVAAWHLLQDEALRADYVHGTEKERHAILHEILRLEPVVSTLYRRAETDLMVGEQAVPKGSLLALNVGAANLDGDVIGDAPETLCPGRRLPRGVQAQGLAFGDGHHRCPGAFLAIKESDVFLRRLLIWNDLRIVSPPSVTVNEVVKGYEIRGLRVSLEN